MKVTLDNPPTAAAPYGDRFAHVARIDLPGGTLLMLSGQVGVDEAGAVIAPGDITKQTEAIFALIAQILAGHGATLADVFHLRTFLTSMDDREAYGVVRRRLVTRMPPPASTTVEISRLFADGLVVEVEATAFVADPG